MKQGLVILAFLGLFLGQCRTTQAPSGKVDNKPKLQSASGAAFAVLPPPSIGALLTVDAIKVDSLQSGKLKAIKITVFRGSDSDFARLTICDKVNSTVCSPSPSKPMESATGVFMVYDLPAQVVTITAESCVLKENSVTPSKPCGEKKSRDYVSTSEKLNSDDALKQFGAIQKEQDKIADQCQAIREGLKNYVSASSNQSADPKVLDSAHNQLDLSTPQLCTDFMASNALPTVVTAASANGADTKKTNVGIAIVLGTFSGVMVAAAMYGTWRLNSALLNRNALNDAIKKLNSGNTDLGALIDRKKTGLVDRVKALAQGNSAIEAIEKALAALPGNAGLEAKKKALDLRQQELNIKERQAELLKERDELQKEIDSLETARRELQSNLDVRQRLEEIKGQATEAERFLAEQREAERNALAERTGKERDAGVFEGKWNDLQVELETVSAREATIQKLTDEKVELVNKKDLILEGMFEHIASPSVSEPGGLPKNEGWNKLVQKLPVEEKAAFAKLNRDGQIERLRKIYQDLSEIQKINTFEYAYDSLIQDFNDQLGKIKGTYTMPSTYYFYSEESWFKGDANPVAKHISGLKGKALADRLQEIDDLKIAIGDKDSGIAGLVESKGSRGSDVILKEMEGVREDLASAQRAGKIAQDEYERLKEIVDSKVQEVEQLRAQQSELGKTPGALASEQELAEQGASIEGRAQKAVESEQGLVQREKELRQIQEKMGASETSSADTKAYKARADALNKEIQDGQKVLDSDFASLAEERRLFKPDTSEAVKSLEAERGIHESEVSSFRIAILTTGIFAVLGTAATLAVGLNLDATPDSTLNDSLANAVANIRVSRQNIENAWQKLGTMGN